MTVWREDGQLLEERSGDSQLKHVFNLIFGNAKLFWEKMMSMGSDWGARDDDVVRYSMLGWAVITARLSNVMS